MRKAISYWSFPGGLEGTKNIKECLAEAKSFGYQGVELGVYYQGTLSTESSKEDMDQIMRDAQEIGIEISGLASVEFWGTNFTSQNQEDVDRGRTLIEKMLELGSYLNLDGVLVIPGAVDVFFDPNAPVVPYDVAYNKCLEGIRSLVPVAEKYKVSIAIENVWNKLFLSPIELKNFIDEIGSEYVGVYFDIGNAMQTGYPEHWIRILGERIKKVHFKDYRRAAGGEAGFVDLLAGDVNWPEVMAALEEIGYRGWATAEMIPLYQHYPEVRLANTSRALDKILASRGGEK